MAATTTGEGAMTQRMFGPYRIEALLGRGGMGEVYRAYDTGQQRMVALKVLLPGLAGDPQFAERFRRESEIVAQLREPHVIPIHRHGEIDGQLFIDMRLVEGAHLGTVLRDGPLDPWTAVDVVGQVASALDAAHADGLVHRDVKPSNVLCAGRGRPTDFVYLVDFGIARSVDGTGITTTGVAVGSVEYMAPERFQSGRVDQRADVYSLACLLFECLSGRRPFVTAERLAVIMAHMQDPPPVLSAARPGAPTVFDDVIVRGLAKAPSDRHPSASAFAEAAREALATLTPPTPATPVPPPAAPPAGGKWWTRANGAPAAKPASAAPPASSPSPPAPTPVGPGPGWWKGASSPPPRPDPPTQPDPPTAPAPAPATPPAPPSPPPASPSPPPTPVGPGPGWWKGASSPPPRPDPPTQPDPPTAPAPAPATPPASPPPPAPPSPSPPPPPAPSSSPSPSPPPQARASSSAAPGPGWWKGAGSPPPQPNPPAQPDPPTAPAPAPLLATRRYQMTQPAPATLPPTVQVPGAGPARPVSSGTWWERKATALHPVGAASVVIGRAPECDVVLADPLVSRRHAELRRVGPDWRIVDLGGWNGTFVNGHRVDQATIGAGDIVGIGHALLHLQGGTLVEYTDSGDISFEADDLVVTRSGRRLLDGVGFALPQRSLLAVVGPSGAGKSTLLGALTGQRPADSGEVRYAGRDLYASYDELRQRIGLVPQDDILHPQLTVRRALRYAAALRFPADTPAAECNARVEEVIGELGLADQAGQRITTLSGGQRKRTSVALELLTRPSLLFLDEPTSGLDPGMDKSVMQTLRKLADDGRTVVVVTHSPAQLDLCDRLLVLASGGRLAYFGPPGEALAYFGQRDFADMFLLLDRSRDVDWTARFRASPQFAKYGMPNGAAQPATPAPRAAPDAPPRQQPALRQFAVLARRYLAVIAADRAYTLFLLALPLVLSLFAQLLPGKHGLSWMGTQADRDSDSDIAPLMLVLVLGCAFTGFAGAFRELVKERSIFRREQAIGLSRGAYLWSKLAVLGAITSAQAVILAVAGLYGQPAPDTPLVLGSGLTEVAVAMIAVALAAMAQGLLVSALIANADRGMPILVVVLLLQFLLCGLLIPLDGRPPLEQLAYLMPARWGFAMVAATTGYHQTPTDPELDPLWTADAGTWALDLAALLLLTTAVAWATWPVLRRGSSPRKGR
ncbi:protein kinase domain-containing protein [Pseudofrankia sp. BMG5.37]|uniref:protein kinase domain-containing protein n=1 Tax=Pseudofrankia sp. BMG5.37 TaxID=3050035 RepID=UPI002894BDDF|nr:ATP-binding cassette domain-containing protein [Pseudofrankia sp. BMG5.37]MDT3446181.1 ATP-binding cassette domain-containing protein [Pseudofrankia sp. BMG5.37]